MAARGRVGVGLSLSPALLFLAILFGCIGLAAFQYGRRVQQARPMILGVALLGLGFLVQDVWINGIVGSVLVVLLFWPR